ncbi:sigma-70 family RNA polymerase sigma factor [bacterium]|nr:MAG: sigma-70 family RNA polymerase sigma factor [bacterium]
MLFTVVRKPVSDTATRERLFEELLKRSNRQAYGLAYRLTGDRNEAEDLVQESFVRAFRFFHRYDESLPFTSWLYRIMANAHIDMMRRKGKIRTTSLDHGAGDGEAAWDVPDSESAPDRLLLEGAMGAEVQEGLNAMNPEFRTAVLLSDVEGMAYEEVAEIMGTSVGTVRSRIHRGRKQLRDHLVRNAPETYRSLCDEL